MTKANKVNSAPLPTAPLLITESRNEFDRLRDELKEEIKPRGFIEQMYIDEFACLVWDIIRLRRCKIAIINLAFRSALKEIITQLLIKPGDLKFQVDEQSKRLAHEWFSDPDVKKEVAELLHEFNLDEAAIEAEAFRKSAEDLERIDRLIASAEARRDKELACIVHCRGDFGALLRGSSDRLLDRKVLKLEDAGSKDRKPAA